MTPEGENTAGDDLPELDYDCGDCVRGDSRLVLVITLVAAVVTICILGGSLCR